MCLLFFSQSHFVSTSTQSLTLNDPGFSKDLCLPDRKYVQLVNSSCSPSATTMKLLNILHIGRIYEAVGRGSCISYLPT